MKLDRSKNAIRNVAYGTAEKLSAIVFPFAVRTVFTYTLGTEYLGLNGLFTNILNVLNLTELGFSSAIVFSMYKPIAEEDRPSINALLYLYRKVYRCVGLIILAIGLALIPFLPKLVKGSVPADISLTGLYLLYLGNTVLSYFMFAYLGALISAYQRQDAISRINLALSAAKYILQIILLLTVKNYYCYVLVLPVFTVLTNLRTAAVARRIFPEYRPEGRISAEQRAEIRENVSGMMVTKLCWVSRNAFDSIFISAFLGLTETAIYNNYYYIMDSVTLLMGVLTTSILSGVGNSIKTETVEKNYRDMNRLNFLYLWLSGWFTACLLCLYQPFMLLWMGRGRLLPMKVVVLICAYFYALKMGDIRSIYVQAAGLWWQNRYRAIAESAANLLLNYFLGKRFGVAGIVAATLISLVAINYLYGSHLVFKYYFTKQRVSDFFRANAVYALAAAGVTAATFWLCSFISGEGVGALALKALVCAVVPNALLLALYWRTDIFRDSAQWFFSKFPFLQKPLKRLGIHEKTD